MGRGLWIAGGAVFVEHAEHGEADGEENRRPNEERHGLHDDFASICLREKPVRERHDGEEGDEEHHRHHAANEIIDVHLLSHWVDFIARPRLCRKPAIAIVSYPARCIGDFFIRVGMTQRP